MFFPTSATEHVPELFPINKNRGKHKERKHEMKLCVQMTGLNY
jgi:hypothetical protein